MSALKMILMSFLWRLYVCHISERPVPKDIEATDDLSPPPVANGTSLQSEEKDSTGENGTKWNCFSVLKEKVKKFSSE